jgi:hypothetical protein
MDLDKHVTRPIDRLTAESSCNGSGDIYLWSLRRWILPKLETYLSAWGIIAPPDVWTPIDEALSGFKRSIIPEPCWTTNPTLNDELSLPASHGGLDRYPLERRASRSGPCASPLA